LSCISVAKFTLNGAIKSILSPIKKPAAAGFFMAKLKSLYT
jgi:hypothetical protein